MISMLFRTVARGNLIDILQRRSQRCGEACRLGSSERRARDGEVDNCRFSRLCCARAVSHFCRPFARPEAERRKRPNLIALFSLRC
jgi:hypothetical protein